MVIIAVLRTCVELSAGVGGVLIRMRTLVFSFLRTRAMAALAMCCDVDVRVVVVWSWLGSILIGASAVGWRRCDALLGRAVSCRKLDSISGPRRRLMPEIRAELSG